MTNTAHSPEPWGVWLLANDPTTYGENAGKPIITTADGESEITGIIPKEANAHRIVAAVNACEGISTLALETGVLGLMMQALKRAEFLLRRVHEGDHRALRNLPDAADQARDAIAQTTSTTAGSRSPVQLWLTSGRGFSITSHEI